MDLIIRNLTDAQKADVQAQTGAAPPPPLPPVPTTEIDWGNPAPYYHTTNPGGSWAAIAFTVGTKVSPTNNMPNIAGAEDVSGPGTGGTCNHKWFLSYDTNPDASGSVKPTQGNGNMANGSLSVTQPFGVGPGSGVHPGYAYPEVTPGSRVYLMSSCEGPPDKTFSLKWNLKKNGAA